MVTFMITHSSATFLGSHDVQHSPLKLIMSADLSERRARQVAICHLPPSRFTLHPQLGAPYATTLGTTLGFTKTPTPQKATARRCIRPPASKHRVQEVIGGFWAMAYNYALCIMLLLSGAWSKVELIPPEARQGNATPLKDIPTEYIVVYISHSLRVRPQGVASGANVGEARGSPENGASGRQVRLHPCAPSLAVPLATRLPWHHMRRARVPF